jgi:hypothetical protein
VAGLARIMHRCAGSMIQALWEYAEHIPHRSENTTVEENRLMQRALHRPVELAPFIGSWG